MPRQIASDDEMPRRRRRGAKAVAVEAERGFFMRILLRSPKDVVAGALAFAAVSAIIANALFLQAGRHPAPMFGSSVAIPAAALPGANPLPRARPVASFDRRAIAVAKNLVNEVSLPPAERLLDALNSFQVA